MAPGSSTLLLLRFPFSFLLAPIFLLALIASPCPDTQKALFAFLVLHFLLYPASNGFNSYYDRDEGSIGLLRSPPPVTPGLLVWALILDGAALIGAWFVSPLFAAGCLVYGCASKAYSWPGIRIKKYPVAGWLFTGLGQGALTFLLVVHSVSSQPLPAGAGLLPAFLIGLFLLGFYPLTQVYQHAEDARHGDLTLSRLLGVRATFLLAAVFLGLSLSGITGWILLSLGREWSIFFLLASLPAGTAFLIWMLRAVKDPAAADWASLTRVSLLAAGGLNVFAAVTLALR